MRPTWIIVHTECSRTQQLFAVLNMKHSTVTEKFDLVINLTSKIAERQQDVIVPDITQAVILMRILPSEYDTTLEILTCRLEFTCVLCQLRLFFY